MQRTALAIVGCDSHPKEVTTFNGKALGKESTMVTRQAQKTAKNETTEVITGQVTRQREHHADAGKQVAIPVTAPQEKLGNVPTGAEAAAKRREVLANMRGTAELFQRGYAVAVMAVIDAQDWKYAPDKDFRSMEKYLGEYVKPQDMKLQSKEARVALVADMLRVRPDMQLRHIALITGTVKPDTNKSASLGTASRDRKAALDLITQERRAVLPAAPAKPADDATQEEKDAYKDAKALHDKLTKSTGTNVQEEFRKSEPPKAPANPLLGPVNIQVQFTPKDGKRRNDYTNEIRKEAKDAASEAARDVLARYGLVDASPQPSA